MVLKTLRHGLIGALLIAGTASAQDTPILDLVANKVIQKYENATCEQLWEQKAQPKTAEQQQVIELLQSDPQMRTKFIDKIAAPVANKLFSCGMIP